MSRKGPRNCRSLGFARDDKKERVVVKEEAVVKERADVKGEGHLPAPTATLSFNNRPSPTTTLPFLSSRAKPRDLQFRGPSWKCFSTAKIRGP
jgi:hypothetical protein